MRPRPILETGVAETSVPESGRSIADLSADITRMGTSLALRRQLLAVANAAASAGADAAKQAEAAVLYQTLVAGVELAKGLANSTAFGPEVKAEIETQLAEGLALTTDPRMRTAGRERVQQLNEYRQVMNRIARSKLPPELRRALGPAFAYAQTHALRGTLLLFEPPLAVA